jgi:hypothetical protein
LAYLAISQLINDPTFQGRNRAVALQQSDIYRNDARPQFVALAEAILRDDAAPIYALLRINAAGPGIADKADNGDGTIDQAKVSDDDLLSLTQANWQVVASLYYDEEGNPIP